METIIDRCVRKAGSQAELARIVGVTRAAVSIWVKNGRWPDKDYSGRTNRLKTISKELNIPMKTLLKT